MVTDTRKVSFAGGHCAIKSHFWNLEINQYFKFYRIHVKKMPFERTGKLC